MGSCFYLRDSYKNELRVDWVSYMYRGKKLQFTEKVHSMLMSSTICFQYPNEMQLLDTRTTDTQWRHKSKKSEILSRCGRQNMLWPYLKIWEWELIFGSAVKAISSPGVRSSWSWWCRLYVSFQSSPVFVVTFKECFIYQQRRCLSCLPPNLSTLLIRDPLLHA